jgi:hypothetical protein
MSKIAAIDVAVRLQLASDGKSEPANYSTHMGPNKTTPNKQAVLGYDYSDAQLSTFLLNVANRLQLDTPSWHFSWQTLNNCENDTLRLLIAKIETATIPGPTK